MRLEYALFPFPIAKVKEVMDELFHSELLKAILCGQFGDYGMLLGLKWIQGGSFVGQ